MSRNSLFDQLTWLRARRVHWRVDTGVVMIVSSASKGQKGRTLHFVRYLPDRTSSVYRRTADPSHAVLAVGWIPADVSDRSVEIAVNLTVFAGPFGVRHVVHYAEIGRNRLVYLFAP